MVNNVSRQHGPSNAKAKAMKSEIRSTSPDAQLRLSVPPNPRIGVYVRREVLGFAQNHGISGDNVIDFVAAIGEALANAIEHARTEDPIEITAWLLGEDRLFASVADNGIGFSPAERTVSSVLPEPYAERGRGLPIMRECADVFSVRSAPGQGTRVTLGCYVNRAANSRLDRRETAV
jgi:anti-sigma regulatory factor (Ser/Thr protein kinase)